MKPLRVIVTGSRTWTDTAKVYGALDLLAQAARAEGRRLIVAHGACPQGADAIADQWARSRRHDGWPVEPERNPANWRKYGKRRAGFIRNAAMVNLGADCCLAFIDPCANPECNRPRPHGSHGATDCADRAEGAGIPTQRIERADV